MERKYAKYLKELVCMGKTIRQKNTQNDKIKRNNLFSRDLTKKIN